MKVGNKVKDTETGEIWTITNICEWEEVALVAECGYEILAAFECFNNGMYTLVGDAELLKVGDIVKLHRSERRNGRLAGLSGLIVDKLPHHSSHQVLLETGEVVSLHETQIEEVISECR